jgi:hypothetical protein
MEDMDKDDPDMRLFPSLLDGTIEIERISEDDPESESDLVSVNEDVGSFEEFTSILNSLLDNYGLDDDTVYELFLENRDLVIKIELNLIIVSK